MNNNRTAQRIRIEVTATAIRETEKAYQAEVKYWTKFDAPVKTAKMWVPKSCCAAENSTITSIDKFILDKWEEEHRNLIGTHSSYAARKMHIEWDLKRKEGELKKAAEEDASRKKHINDTIAKYLPEVTKTSHKLMAELGSIARTYGRIWKEEGTDAAACDEFIKWGNALGKKYGFIGDDAEFYENAKKLSAKDRSLYVEFIWNTWVFGDFCACAPGRNADFYDVIDILLKKQFKKEMTFFNEYKGFINNFWKLNGNRY